MIEVRGCIVRGYHLLEQTATSVETQLPAPSGASRRALYRVVYPMADHPVIEIGRHVHDVIDVCERGLRYEVLERGLPAVGTQLRGVVKFRRGE